MLCRPAQDRCSTNQCRAGQPKADVAQTSAGQSSPCLTCLLDLIKSRTRKKTSPQAALVFSDQIRSGLSVRNSSDSEDLKERHDRGDVSNTKRADVIPEHVCYKRRLRQNSFRTRPPAGINPCGGQLAIGSLAYHR